MGLVGHMPSGPGVIPDELIRKIVDAVPPPVATFLLTSETSSQAIIKHHDITRTNTIQIVDKLSEGTYRELREAPELRGMPIVVVSGVSADDARERLLFGETLAPPDAFIEKPVNLAVLIGTLRGLLES